MLQNALRNGAFANDVLCLSISSISLSLQKKVVGEGLCAMVQGTLYARAWVHGPTCSLSAAAAAIHDDLSRSLRARCSDLFRCLCSDARVGCPETTCDLSALGALE